MTIQVLFDQNNPPNIVVLGVTIQVLFDQGSQICVYVCMDVTVSDLSVWSPVGSTVFQIVVSLAEMITSNTVLQKSVHSSTSQHS